MDGTSSVVSHALYGLVLLTDRFWWLPAGFVEHRLLASYVLICTTRDICCLLDYLYVWTRCPHPPQRYLVGRFFIHKH